MQQWWPFKKRHDHMLNEYQTMISFSSLLICMGVFILVLIHLLLFVHKPLSCVINNFLSPLNACFLLLTTHVHSPITCASHCNSSMGCYIWSRFFIFFTHHNWCTFDINQFVVDDNSFILGLFCYYWLSFRGHESSLHRIFN